MSILNIYIFIICLYSPKIQPLHYLDILCLLLLRLVDNKNLTRINIYSAYDGEVSEPLVGRQGSRVSMRVARGSASLLPSHGRGIWPRDVLKKVSRGLSCVEAGNPGFPRLVQVTSGGFSWWL